MQISQLVKTNFAGIQDTIDMAHIEAMAYSIGAGGAQFLMNITDPDRLATKGAFQVQGHRIHGDSAPTWWANVLTEPTKNDPGGVLKRYWNAVNTWGAVFPHADNTTTNAFTAMYDIQLYLLSNTTGRWSRADGRNGIPAYPFDYYTLDPYTLSSSGSYTHDPTTSRRGWSNVPTAGDRAAPSSDVTKYRTAHGTLTPWQTVDGEDVGGIFVTCKAHLFTASDEAFNGVTKLYARVGLDMRPSINDALNAGELAGATYYPGAGGGALIELPTDRSSVRISYCSVGGSGFSTIIDNADNSPYGSVYPVYLSYSEIAANLPSLQFNAAV